MGRVDLKLPAIYYAFTSPCPALLRTHNVVNNIAYFFYCGGVGFHFLVLPIQPLVVGGLPFLVRFPFRNWFKSGDFFAPRRKNTTRPLIGLIVGTDGLRFSFSLKGK